MVLSDFQKAQLPPSTTQLKCEAAGGKWDATNQTCIHPEPKPEPKPDVKIKTPEIIREEDTGRPSAITLPDGKTFFGTQKELAELAASKAARDPLALPIGTAEAGTAQRAVDIEEQQRILQTTGAPVRRELDPTLEPGETTPLIGPLKIKIRKTAANFLKDTALRNFIDSFNPREQEEFFQLEPEILATVALTEIERREIERGLTDSEKFGSWIEALNLGGLSNFIAEKPSENVQTLLKRIKTAKTEATNAEIKVKDGTWRISLGNEVITTQKNRIQEIESRIKLLIQESQEFKFDSDGVNFIEDKILEARGRLFSAEINILSGESDPLTKPSDIQILIALQESIERESFEI